jgi:Tfp pilus assembly protein PilF
MTCLALVALLASAAPSEPERAFLRGDFARASTLARQRLEAHPEDVGARIVLARAEAAEGRFDSAYAEFQAASRKAPRDPDVLYYLSVTAGLLAEAEFERVFALAPDSARAHQLRGESWKAQGRTEDAERELRVAIEKNPRSVDALLALGDLLRAKLGFAEAQVLYERALVVSPSSYSALYGLGICHSFRGEQARAATVLRRALEVDGSSASARLALGTALLQTGRSADAVRELEAAVALEPRLRQAHYQLGRAYQAQGREAEAQASFARVQQLLAAERAGGEEPVETPEQP